MAIHFFECSYNFWKHRWKPISAISHKVSCNTAFTSFDDIKWRPCIFFSLMGTDENHTVLSPVNRVNVKADQCKFSRGSILPIRSNALMLYHAEGTCVQTQRFVQVFGGNLFKHIQTPMHQFQRSLRSKIVQRLHHFR